MRAFGSLRRQSDFTRLYRRAKRFAQPGLMLYAMPAHPAARFPRVGIAVSKTVGNAVRRNLVRRRIQSTLDTFALNEGGLLDFLVVAKPGAAELPYSIFADQLDHAVRAARRTLASGA